jgi:hypothetical protein
MVPRQLLPRRLVYSSSFECPSGCECIHDVLAADGFLAWRPSFRFCLQYLDNILITKANAAEHCCQLRTVFLSLSTAVSFSTLRNVSSTVASSSSLAFASAHLVPATCCHSWSLLPFFRSLPRSGISRLSLDSSISTGNSSQLRPGSFCC